MDIRNSAMHELIPGGRDSKDAKGRQKAGGEGQAHFVNVFVAYLRAPDLRFGTLRMNTLVWHDMNRCLFTRWAWKHQQWAQTWKFPSRGST